MTPSQPQAHHQVVHTDRPDQAYQSAASFVPKLATKVVQWLDPQKDDVILDVGCGGAFTF